MGFLVSTQFGGATEKTSTEKNDLGAMGFEPATLGVLGRRLTDFTEDSIFWAPFYEGS